MSVALFALFLLAAVPAAWIDWKSYRIPDPLSLGCLLAAIVLCALVGPVELPARLAAAAVAFALALLVRYLTKGAFGLGDAKLLAAGAFCLGALPAYIMTMAACALALAYGLILRARGRERPIPFGPFIAFGAIVASVPFAVHP